MFTRPEKKINYVETENKITRKHLKTLRKKLSGRCSDGELTPLSLSFFLSLSLLLPHPPPPPPLSLTHSLRKKLSGICSNGGLGRSECFFKDHILHDCQKDRVVLVE